jgi:hypothetical protein
MAAGRKDQKTPSRTGRKSTGQSSTRSRSTSKGDVTLTWEGGNMPAAVDFRRERLPQLSMLSWPGGDKGG